MAIEDVLLSDAFDKYAIRPTLFQILQKEISADSKTILDIFLILRIKKAEVDEFILFLFQ